MIFHVLFPGTDRERILGGGTWPPGVQTIFMDLVNILSMPHLLNILNLQTLLNTSNLLDLLNEDILDNIMNLLNTFSLLGPWEEWGHQSIHSQHRTGKAHSIDCPSRNNAGVFATGEIRQNVKFATFWSVFLTTKKGRSWKLVKKYTLLNCSEKRKFLRTTWHV